MKKDNKKSIAIVSIVSIIIVLLLIPILIETLKMNSQFKMIYNGINETLKNKVEELDSSYSKYYDIKSLKYEVNKIYKTDTFDEYGYEITFSVDSDYYFSYYNNDTTYYLMLDCLDVLLSELVRDLGHKGIMIEHYKYILKINGKDVYTEYEGSNYSIYDEFIDEQYNEYKIKIEKNYIVWEQTSDGLKLKSMTNYMYIILILLASVSILLIIISLIKFYEKNASSNTKATIGCLGEFARHLILFILIGIFTGGVGFIAIPLLWILNNRN